MKTLIIVESPHKAQTIQNYLGKDYVVLASKGHVRDLPAKSLGIDIEHGFKPDYIITPDKESVIKKLKSELAKYDEVYLATDPDREGEAISWHLKDVLGIKKDCVRIEFNEISKNAVLNALQNPREIDMNLVNSQQARRVLDRLVGYKISPIISRKIKNGLSAGRVQSPALKMIVEREREIKAFKPEEYWNIFASLLKDGEKKTKQNMFNAALNDRAGKKIKVKNATDAMAISDVMKGLTYVVDDVVPKLSIVKPQPPFTTSTMQQEASHKLGFTADRTSKLAQSLYEGVKIDGEGQHSLITYIRTDSVRVSPDFQKATYFYIKDTYGNEYAPAKLNVYKTSESAQDAHEAIRPIDFKRTPKSLEGKMDKDAFRLYKLIYERYIASQMTPAQYNTLTCHIKGEDGANNYGFVVKGKAVKFKGYTAVYSQTEEKDEENQELDMLPNLQKGELLNLEEVKSEQKFTQPPKRYTDATLVKALEDNGIGRPSTYASIITLLANREYTEKKQKAIAPTELGESVCDYMEDNFTEIMNLDFTARLEGALDKVAIGGQEWQDLIGKFYPYIAKSIVKASGVKGGQVAIITDTICEKCGANMVKKHGKVGDFLACPNYPKCKNTKSILEIVAKCPKCGSGIVKRQGKKSIFYGCTNYPACDFASWDLPAPKLCPECASTMKIVKRDEKTYYNCTNNKCKHKELVIDSVESPYETKN